MRSRFGGAKAKPRSTFGGALPVFPSLSSLNFFAALFLPSMIFTYSATKKSSLFSVVVVSFWLPSVVVELSFELDPIRLSLKGGALFLELSLCIQFPDGD